MMGMFTQRSWPTQSGLFLCIILWCLLLAVLGLHCCPGFFFSCSKRELLSSCRVWLPIGFSCCRAQPLGFKGFRSCGSWALEHRFNSCGKRAELLLRIWDLPGSGIGPVSPALAGEFFTTEPPGKPNQGFYFSFWKAICC